MAKPDKLDIIWARTGVSVDPGDAKFELGWEAEIPPYQNFNYILNKHSAMLDHINTYGIPEWDAATTYALGAKTLYNGIEYECTSAGSTGDQPDTLNDWKVFPFDQDLNTTDDVEFNKVTTDNIEEATGGNGVTIEQVDFKAGRVDAPLGRSAAVDFSTNGATGDAWFTTLTNVVGFTKLIASGAIKVTTSSSFVVVSSVQKIAPTTIIVEGVDLGNGLNVGLAINQGETGTQLRGRLTV